MSLTGSQEVMVALSRSDGLRYYVESREDRGVGYWSESSPI